MHHFNNTHTTLRRWTRVASTIAAALAVSVSLVLVAPGGAQAARRTSAAPIAQQAERALDALDRWQRTQDPADYIAYARNRGLTATLTALDLEVSERELSEAWAHVDITKQEAVLAAMSQLGVPYEYYGMTPETGFDCSGLLLWAFGLADVTVPRVSRDQIRSATPVERAEAQAGDLVYYPGHISMYLGADTMVHSPNTGSVVEVVHLPDRSLQFGDAVSA